jgi:hypothetical protein
MALFVLLLSLIIFPLGHAEPQQGEPGSFQQFLELIVGG